jgi:TolB-like protein
MAERDESENPQSGGDAWDASIRRQIKSCALFIPVISRNTHTRGEGYFRLEWKLAVDRSHLMASDLPFLGSVRRSGHTIRVTAQLNNALTGYHLWSQTYDRDLGDVLKLQTDIANAVTRGLKLTLLGDVAWTPDDSN